MAGWDLLGIEQKINGWFIETEQEVVHIVAQLKSDVEVAIQDVDKALSWVAQQTPNIAAGLQTVVGLVETVGVAGNPEVAAAIQAANIAVSALNAFAASANSGKTYPQAVVDGYVAYKSAQASVASATAAAVKTPTASATAAVTASVPAQPAQAPAA